MRILYTFLLVSIAVGLCAQDYPRFSQHVNLQGLINPAYNGSRESYSALLVSRNQYGGAVKTFAFNAHAPLPIEGLGAGLVVMQDQIGLNSNLSAIAALSYRISIADDVTLAAGLQGGVVREQVGDATLVDGRRDPAVDNFGVTTNRPSVGLGFYVYSSQFFGGVSLPDILPDGAESDGTFYNDIPLLLYGGVLLAVSDEVKLKPAAFLQATYASPIMMEFGLSAFYKDYGSFGVSTRTYPFSSLVFALETKVIESLFIAYSYDLSIGGAPDGMKKGAHEISLRFDITAKDMLTKPSGSMRFF